VTFANGSARYAIRVVGPAGHVRYLTGNLHSDPMIYESDALEGVLALSDAYEADVLAQTWQRTHANVICDVVNLDDPEERSFD